MNNKILLVEDDTSLGETLYSRLLKLGFFIEWVQTLAQAKDLLGSSKFSLVLLDVGLPDGSGFDLAKEIKHIPFIFLTALNNAEDRLSGYELGAVEYIPKPFHLKELLIKIDRVLNVKQNNIISFEGYSINFDTMIITKSNGEAIQPSSKDFKLLAYLIENAPRVISRDEILDNLWGEQNYPSTRTIDNSIVRLRQIFNDTSNSWIKSIRGIGYQWIRGEQ